MTQRPKGRPIVLDAIRALGHTGALPHGSPVNTRLCNTCWSDIWNQHRLPPAPEALSCVKADTSPTTIGLDNLVLAAEQDHSSPPSPLSPSSPGSPLAIDPPSTNSCVIFHPPAFLPPPPFPLSQPQSLLPRLLPPTWWLNHSERSNAEAKALLLGDPINYLPSVHSMCHRNTHMDLTSIRRGSNEAGEGAKIFTLAENITVQEWGRLLTIDECVRTEESSGGEEDIIDQHWAIASHHSLSYSQQNFDRGAVFYGLSMSQSLGYGRGRNRSQWIRWATSKTQREGQDERVVLGTFDDDEEVDAMDISESDQKIGTGQPRGGDHRRWRCGLRYSGRSEWQAALGGDREDDRRQADLLSYPCNEFKALSKSVRQSVTGEQAMVFINNGPGTNGAHWDAIGGYSSLIDGSKVFVCWDVRGDHDEDRHWKGGLVDLEALIRDKSMWWALVGPNCTILLEADQPHFVVNFTSSVLITWSRTYYPSRIFASLCTTLEGQIQEGDPTWDIEPSNRREKVLRLLRGVLHASAERIRGWQRQGDVQRVKRTVQGWGQCWKRRLHRDLFGLVACSRDADAAHEKQSGKEVELWVDLIRPLEADPTDGFCVDEFLTAIS